MDGVNLFHVFLQTHKTQLESSGVPTRYWEILSKKLRNQIFDAGSVFQIARIDYEDTEKSPWDPLWKLFVCREEGISLNDPNHIYLIDHSWTYDVSRARQNLLQVPGLLDRMCQLMGILEEDRVEGVLREMWRYNQSFSLNTGSIEERMPVWYIMDELGSAINHSDRPNFRTVPFLHVPEGVTYTLLFPIRDVESEEEVTRDFVEGQTNDPKKRRVLLLPWKRDTFLDESFLQVEPDDRYFLSGHEAETLPRSKTNTDWTEGRKLKVYSQYVYVSQYLTDENFEVTQSREDADILWLTDHFKDYETLSVESPGTFVNQFPFENVLTIKDLLAIVCRRKAGERKFDPENLETFPEWMPTTYNLHTELVEFCSYFQHRQERGLDNLWICKPWNLARGLDTHITANLYQILRLPSTGPKIAQKYIENPVLFQRDGIGKVKFDVRYVILLKSTDPLEVYVYRNFFLRFANKEFQLTDFDDYEKHFTVMNYTENELCHLKCREFLGEWESQYDSVSWKDEIEPKILEMFRNVFETAVMEEPPKGIGRNPQSRALYAADLMLKWDQNGRMQPILLEINFSPDCKRACEYYNDFYDDVFKCLFLGTRDPDKFYELK